MLTTLITTLLLATITLFAAERPKTAPATRTASPAAAHNTNRPQNATLCSNYNERMRGWARTLASIAVHKATSETALANCVLREKDKTVLLGQCEQYEDQIADWKRQLKYAKEESEKLIELSERYCRR